MLLLILSLYEFRGCSIFSLFLGLESKLLSLYLLIFKLSKSAVYGLLSAMRDLN
jgi:hypothetical protein